MHFLDINFILYECYQARINMELRKILKKETLLVSTTHFRSHVLPYVTEELPKVKEEKQI